MVISRFSKRRRLPASTSRMTPPKHAVSTPMATATNGIDAEAKRLGGADHRIDGKPKRIEPDQRLGPLQVRRGKPHGQRRGQSDAQIRRVADPEHRRADQQIAQRAAADAGHHREEPERNDVLPVTRGRERAGERENRHARIIQRRRQHRERLRRAHGLNLPC